MKNSKKMLIGGVIAVLVISAVAVLGTGSGDELLGRVNVKRNNSQDFDRDGLTNQQEANIGTDPLKKDTDGDGKSDEWEVSRGCDPLVWTSTPSCSPDADADGDLLSRWVESFMHTDLANPDTDGDGYSDGVEVGEAYQVSWGETPFIDPELVSDPLDPCDPNPQASACVAQNASIERR